MLGFIARLVGGALDPLIDQVSTASARLLRKLALFLVAGVCLVVVLIALTIAFDLWVASKLGAIAGALAVAGVYLAVAIAAVCCWRCARTGRARSLRTLRGKRRHETRRATAAARRSTPSPRP